MVAPLEHFQKGRRQRMPALKGARGLFCEATCKSSLSATLNPCNFPNSRCGSCRMTKDWLGGRDSNPDNENQNLASYRWTTSQDYFLLVSHFLLGVATVLNSRFIGCYPFGFRRFNSCLIGRQVRVQEVWLCLEKKWISVARSKF